MTSWGGITNDDPRISSQGSPPPTGQTLKLTTTWGPTTLNCPAYTSTWTSQPILTLLRHWRDSVDHCGRPTSFQPPNSWGRAISLSAKWKITVPLATANSRPNEVHFCASFTRVVTRLRCVTDAKSGEGGESGSPPPFNLGAACQANQQIHRLPTHLSLPSLSLLQMTCDGAATRSFAQNYSTLIVKISQDTAQYLKPYNFAHNLS